jgi:hypothetical protein
MYPDAADNYDVRVSSAWNIEETLNAARAAVVGIRQQRPTLTAGRALVDIIATIVLRSQSK